jgi:hypothetical protein
MIAADKEALLMEIRQAEGKQTNATPLAGHMRRWLECQDSQEAANALARALALQGNGDPIYPRSGIWPIPPA